MRLLWYENQLFVLFAHTYKVVGLAVCFFLSWPLTPKFDTATWDFLNLTCNIRLSGMGHGGIKGSDMIYDYVLDPTCDMVENRRHRM